MRAVMPTAQGSQRGRRGALRLLAVTLLTATIACGAIQLPPFAPQAAHAAGIDVVTNPATTTRAVDKCGSTLGCVYSHGYKILDPTVPVPDADRAAIDALQDGAVTMFTALHTGAAADPRIVQNGEAEIRGLMWQLVQMAVFTAPADRTPFQAQTYDWFQHVVQNYNLTAARNAKREYETWLVRQCGYQPPVPSPAYYSGLACDPEKAGVVSLLSGPITPTIEMLQQWGAASAAQSLTKPRQHGDPATFAQAASTSFEVGQLVASAYGAITSLSADLTSVGVEWMQGMSELGEWSARTAFQKGIQQSARSLGLVLDSVLGPVLAYGAPFFTLAAAAASLVMAIVRLTTDAKVPGQLQAGIDGAAQLPDLKAMLTDPTSSSSLYLLFLGQTAINNVNAPSAGSPDWHGDRLLVRAADNGGNPVEPGTAGKAATLRTWGAAANAPTVTVLSDLGWFQESIDGGSSYLTTTTLNYRGWDGQERTAMLHDTQFVDLPGAGSQAEGYDNLQTCEGNVCQLTSTIKALDANGAKVFVTLQADRPVPAAIQTSSDTFTEGVATTLSAPAGDPAGTTYTWKLESRNPAQMPYSICEPPADPRTRLCDPAFHDHPAVTMTGRSVSYAWPTTGTLHVRLTTTTPTGKTDVADRDVTVLAGAAPTIQVVGEELGPMRSGGVASIAGCLDTAPGAYALPEVTVDWGDGTTTSAKPASGPVFIGLDPVVRAPLTVGRGGNGDSCADWSIRGTHTYTSAVEKTFRIVVSADDGEGRTVLDDTMNAVVGPSDISVIQLSAWNVDDTTNMIDGVPDGLPLYTAGDDVEVRTVFDFPPNAPAYDENVQYSWGDGTNTAFFKTSCPCPTDYTDHHIYAPKAGTPGIGVYDFTVLLLDDDGKTVSQWTTQIAVKNVPPTLTDLQVDHPSVDIGEPVTLTGHVDSDFSSPLQVTVTWGGNLDSTIGPKTQTITVPPGQTTFSVSQPGFLSLGVTPIKVRVADNAGGVTTDSVAVTVNNIDPVPTVDPVIGTEGTPLSLVVHTGVPPNSHAYIETVDWGDGTTPSTESYGATSDGDLPSPEHTYAEAGTYDVAVTLDDQLGGVATTVGTATIAPAPPALTLDPGTGTAGSSATLTGTITDPGAADTFTATVDWRDGTAPQILSVPDGDTALELDHTYALGGVYAPTVVVVDQHDVASSRVSGVLTVAGSPAFTGTTYSTPAGTVLDVSDGELGVPYSFTFGTSGYPTPSITLAAGALPPGLTLGADGILSGIPTLAGTYAFTVTATNGHGTVTTERPVQVVVGTRPDITTATLPGGLYDVGYSYQIVSAGFPAPTFVVAGGHLPPGLSLSPSGLLMGTPTVSGSYAFTVTATNFLDEDTSADLSLTVTTRQQLTFTSTPPTSAVVGQRYAPSATGGGSGQPVLLAVNVGSAAICSLADGTVVFLHPGACRIDATQASAPGFAPGAASQTIAVTKAASRTTVSVQADRIAGRVEVIAPGAADVSGTVTFRVGGDVVGTAEITNGRASLDYTVPNGQTRQVSAEYVGTADLAGSSDSVARHNPTITAAVSSEHGVSQTGWYRDTVTVTFACAPDGAPLAESCPAPVHLRHDGAGQSVTRTVSAADGGIGTVSVKGINIDSVRPTVRVRGVTDGELYQNPPQLACVSSDAGSGVDSCTVSKQKTARAHVVVFHYRATATDNAGNVRTETGVYRVSRG